MKKNIIIILIIIIVLILCIYILNNYSNDKINTNQIKNYTEDLKNFSFNVITLYNPDRLFNISEQEKILPHIKINKFNAIKGIELNQDELVINKILNKNFKYPSLKRSNEIGCYLSHLELLRSLKKSSAKYHIVFEDDFKFILDTDFLLMIKNAINQTKFNSFDIIFLGWNISDNNSERIIWSKNLIKFNLNNLFYGNHAYMVNSNSLDKIINLISEIDMPIDTKYNVLYSSNKLDFYWINPIIIEPNYGLISTILSN
jgi:GR25 family glycosyltransferase involved in LPS biosynthesis